VDVETLPLQVADSIIATQEIVCQEKKPFYKFLFCHWKILATLRTTGGTYDPTFQQTVLTGTLPRNGPAVNSEPANGAIREPSEAMPNGRKFISWRRVIELSVQSHGRARGAKS
jgi:hypothetical protein